MFQLKQFFPSFLLVYWVKVPNYLLMFYWRHSLSLYSCFKFVVLELVRIAYRRVRLKPCFSSLGGAVSRRALDGLKQHLCIKGMGCLFQCPNLPYLFPSYWAAFNRLAISELMVFKSRQTVKSLSVNYQSFSIRGQPKPGFHSKLTWAHFSIKSGERVILTNPAPVS